MGALGRKVRSKDLRRSPASFATLAAIRRALAELSTELIDEGASSCQIGKAPAVEDLLLPINRTSVTWLNMSRLMKIYDPAA
jgi:hypothetical protein